MPQPKPDLDLTSVYAKLDRAEEHFKAVDAEIKAWLNSGRYEAFFERGAEMTRVGMGMLRVGPPPDLVRWSVIIGDCINNLRSVLDHLIHAFCKMPSVYTPSSDKERLSFLIIDDPDDFTKALDKKFSGLLPKFRNALEHLQPFNRTHPVLPPLLSIIRDLSNADKHRLLQVAGASVTNIAGNILHTPGGGTHHVYVNPDPIEHNDIVCVVESSEPDPNLGFEKMSGNVEIAVWHRARNGSADPLEGRTGYSALFPLLIEEVRYAINIFKSLT